MRRLKYLSIILIIFAVFSFVLTSPVQAQSENNNSVLNTLKKLLQTIIGPIEQRLSLVEDRTTNLEVWTQNPQTQPQCATCTAEIAVKVVNEEEAINSLRSIHLAQEKFKKDDSDGDNVFDYAEQLPLLFESSRLIDNVLATGDKRGYKFDLQIDPNLRWHVNANPKQKGKTGDRSFYIDETGVIRYDASASATVGSAPIGG